MTASVEKRVADMNYVIGEVKDTPADAPLVRCSVSANQETLLMS